jgi:nucleotide-binding universal stress UspA family protein
MPRGTSLKTMVVATDFSDTAAQALDWATTLAKAHGAQIVLAHAVDTDLPALAEAQGPIGMTVRRKLEALHRRLIAGQVPAQTEYDLGRPWSVIASVAKRAHADLIVVGAHGRSTLSERVLGTVADRLIRTASTPVLVHRDGSTKATGVRTVLAATDFSEEAALAMKTAVGLLPASGDPGRLVLLHAVAMPIDYADVPVPPLTEYWLESQQAATEQLEGLAAGLRSDRLQVEVKAVRGDPAEEIVREAAAVNADLIAMGTVGRTRLGRILLGSVAERVLHRARCPVLTVRRAETGE